MLQVDEQSCATTAYSKICEYVNANGLRFGGRNQVSGGTVASVLTTRPPILYDEVLVQSRRVWQEKNMKVAAAAANGQRYVEPVQYPGVARLHQIRADFGSAVAMWQEYQAKVFEDMVNANIINILGTDSDRCLERVMRDSHWSEVPDEMLVVAARGSGKSTTLAAAVAAFLKNIPGYTAMVYSGIQSKGNDLLDSIFATFMSMCANDPNFHPDHIRKTSTIISFSVDGDFRQIRAASSLGMLQHTIDITNAFDFPSSYEHIMSDPMKQTKPSKPLKFCPKSLRTASEIIGVITDCVSLPDHHDMTIACTNKLKKAAKDTQKGIEVLDALSQEHSDISQQLAAYTQRYCRYVIRAREAMDECKTEHAYLSGIMGSRAKSAQPILSHPHEAPVPPASVEAVAVAAPAMASVTIAPVTPTPQLPSVSSVSLPVGSKGHDTGKPSRDKPVIPVVTLPKPSPVSVPSAAAAAAASTIVKVRPPSPPPKDEMTSERLNSPHRHHTHNHHKNTHKLKREKGVDDEEEEERTGSVARSKRSTEELDTKQGSKKHKHKHN